MPIANYSTTVNPHKSIGEIEQILARNGVRAISKDYNEDGLPVGLTFMIFAHASPVNFRLPANIDGVHQVLQYDREVPRRFKTREQAERVAWRLLKDWIRAQMGIIEAGLSTTLEVFLPYAVMPQDGRTLYQAFSENPQLLLEAHES